MNKEDERFRKLFQQLKAEDGHNAPPFSHDWTAALSKMDKPRRRWAAWQISAGVTAILILLGTGRWMLFRQSTMPFAPVEVARVDISAPTTLPPMISPSAPQIASPGSTSSVHRTAPPVLRAPTRTRISLYIAARQHPIRQLQRPAALISQWRSPTESLLQTPGEQLFKRVPRLDDSVVNIKTIISNQKN